MGAAYEFQFSYVRAGPCAYPNIKEQYTLKLTDFSKYDDLEVGQA